MTYYVNEICTCTHTRSLFYVWPTYPIPLYTPIIFLQFSNPIPFGDRKTLWVGGCRGPGVRRRVSAEQVRQLACAAAPEEEPGRL
eukprot:450737-Pyramimonas_sp.AAC.1